MNAGHELFGRLETGEEVHRITIRGGGLEVKSRLLELEGAALPFG